MIEKPESELEQVAGIWLSFWIIAFGSGIVIIGLLAALTGVNGGVLSFCGGVGGAVLGFLGSRLRQVRRGLFLTAGVLGFFAEIFSWLLGLFRIFRIFS